MEQQLLAEILGDAELYGESLAGPGGPWIYEAVVIRRRHNTILVSDLDGGTLSEIYVDDLPNGDEAYSQLSKRLDGLNDTALTEL